MGSVWAISDSLSTGVDGRFGGDGVGESLGHGGAGEECNDGETHLDFGYWVCVVGVEVVVVGVESLGGLLKSGRIYESF